MIYTKGMSLPFEELMLNDYPFFEREAILNFSVWLENDSIPAPHDIDDNSLKSMFNLPPNSEVTRSVENQVKCYSVKIKYRESAVGKDRTSLDLKYPSLAEMILEDKKSKWIFPEKVRFSIPCTAEEKKEMDSAYGLTNKD